MEVILQHTGALMTCLIAASDAPAQTPLLVKVGDMLLKSIPTALLFLVLVVAYEFLVQKPLTAMLARRRALTEGAMEEAQRAIAAAEARAAEYAEKLRLARADAYKIREQRTKQWNAERDAALEASRKSAGQKVSQARAGIESEAAAARQTIAASAADLGALAVRAVLPVATGGSVETTCSTHSFLRPHLLLRFSGGAVARAHCAARRSRAADRSGQSFAAHKLAGNRRRG